MKLAPWRGCGIALSVTFLSLSVSAQSVELQKKLTGLGGVPPKAWILPFSAESGSSMHSEWSTERQAYSTFSMAPSYRLNSSFRLSMATSFTKSHSGVGDAQFDNTLVAATYLHKLNDRMNWSLGGGGILPTNPVMKEETSYQGAVRLNTGVSVADLFRGGFLNYRLTLTRNLHEFSQAANGSFNLQYAMTNGMDYTQPLGGAFSLTAVLSYTQAWTYVNDERYNFFFSTDLAYQAADKLTLSFGTANSGSALRPNGRDSNIQFLNDETSIFRMGLTYVL